jgi:hypothetical protein
MGTYCVEFPDNALDQLNMMIANELGFNNVDEISPITLNIGRSKIHPDDYNKTFNKKLGRTIANTRMESKTFIISYFNYSSITGSLDITLLSEEYKVTVRIKNEKIYLISAL